MFFCNWILSKSPERFTFPKVTYQRTWDDNFIPMENSALVHATKHPEVLSILGWEQDSLLLMGQESLKREYLKSVKVLSSDAIKKGIKTAKGRNNREELTVERNGETWLIVFEQEMRNIGKKQNPFLVPVGPLKVVTCYGKSVKSAMTLDPYKILQKEFLRLSGILYAGSPCELEYKLSGSMFYWEINIDDAFVDWEQDVWTIFKNTFLKILSYITVEFPKCNCKSCEFGWDDIDYVVWGDE